MQKLFTLILCSLLSMVLIASFSGCTGGGTVSDSELVVTWGDTAMTVTDFKDKMIVRYANESSAMKKTMDERLKILDEYLERALKIAEGYRLNFDEREDIRKAYDEAKERKASDILYDRMVQDAFITDEMLQDFWEHYRYEVRCRHILIAMDKDVKGRDTLEYWERINEVWEEAGAGEKFEMLVSKYSDDESIDRHLKGDLGYFKWGKMVDEFQEAAWALKPGEISKPLRTRYGYHLIKLIDKRSTGLEAHTSHIMVNVNRRASPAETTAAWERATMILEEARKPGADFSQLARRYSEDNKTWVNSEVGWIPRGSMPSEYWDKALTMKPGEIDGPVQTYKGYHIIKLNEFRDRERSPDDPDIRDRVKSSIMRVYRDSINTISEAYIESVKKEFDMKYDQKVIKLMMRKLGDKNAPKNMNLFSSFTPEEREMLVVTDKLGGLKIADLVERYGDHRFPPTFEDTDDFVKGLVEPIILPGYLSEIARRDGLFDLPEVLAEAKKAIENAMLPEVEREMVFNKATPSEDEIRAEYENNIDKYTDPPKVAILEVMVDDKQLAEDLLARIEKGEDIAKLAMRYSQRKQSKHRDGKLGPFPKDKYGDVSLKAFELEIGEIAGPIEDNGKYSVFKVIEKKQEMVKTFDEVRRQIESDIRFERQKSLKSAWVKELRKSYNVKIHKDIIKRVWPLVDPLPETLEAERKVWKKEREEIAKRAKRKAVDEQIQLKLKPGSEQTYTTKDGRQIQVKIGEPRYKTKDGKEIDPSESNIRLTPKGRLEKKGDKDEKEKKAPKISIKPKKKGSGSGK